MPGEDSSGSRPLIEERALADIKLGDIYETPGSMDESSNSTSSSIENCVERRRDHEFIPTRLQCISASRPAQNPQQFTRLQSNPLLESAQQQMMRVEEVKRLKQLAKSKETAEEHQPEWLSELSSWKHRRRKQSEEALMRVAEMKVLEDAEKTGRRSNASLTKKLSSLLIMDEADNWSDLGLERTIPSKDSIKTGHQIRVREIPREENEDEDEDDEEEKPVQSSNENNFNEHHVMDSQNRSEETQSPHKSDLETQSVNKSDLETQSVIKSDLETQSVIKSDLETQSVNKSENEPKNEPEIKPEIDTVDASSSVKEEMKDNFGSESKRALFDRWSSMTTMGNSASQTREQPRRRSNEIASGLKSKLEAFQRESTEERSRKTSEPVNTDGNAFREKLKNFQRISSQSDVNQGAQEKPKPPPPLKYSQLIGSCNNGEVERSEEVFSEEVSKDLEDALEESYRSVLEEEERLRERKQVLDHVNAMKNNQADQENNEGQENGDNFEQEEQQNGNQMPKIDSLGYSSTTKREHHQQLQQEQWRQEQLRQEQLKQEQLRQDQLQRQQRQQVLQQQQQNEQRQQQLHQRAHSTQRAYDQHWLVHEAEQRRLCEQSSSQLNLSQPIYENNAHIYGNTAFAAPELPRRHNSNDANNNRPIYSSENLYANLGPNENIRTDRNRDPDARLPGPQVSSSKSESERMLSVSGRKKCSHCNQELGRGAAMIIESLRLFYHLRCFKCSVCQVQLGNGSAGTDVRVRNNKLHCQNCYSNDDGLKFSKV